jgi:uncharacterized protein (TIGR03382 family)|nr:trypsin-like serine protease [Kofleriaceae bacterium]
MVAVAAGAVTGVATRADAAPIIGGSAAQLGDFPNVVAIAIGSGSRFAVCTGELIEPDVVMTAAHCLAPAVVCPGLGLGSDCTQDQITALTTVFSGTVDLITSRGSESAAASTVFDSKFDATDLGHDDMGLIKLTAPVAGVTVALPNLHHGDAPAGMTVTMVGFGTTEQGGQGSVGEEFALQNRASEPCSMLPALKGATASDDNLLCYSQSDGKGKCEGDSGGPSFAVVNGKTKIVGITSFGDTSCAELGTDTRVDAEHRFLYSQVPDLECASDADCDGGRACFSGQCTRLSGAGAIGDDCGKDADCDTGECTAAPDGTKVCTIECAAAGASDADTCPAEFACETSGGSTSCFDGHAGGGCCDSGGGGGGGAAVLAMATVLVAGRRRRRRAGQVTDRLSQS